MSDTGDKDFRKLRGMLWRPGQRALSVEEMNEAIGRFHAEEMRRIDEYARAEREGEDIDPESDPA
jgi:hypothetical protein